jgi:hypothetical protein
MADIRIKDLATTATTTASDDFMAVDGAINGTRKLSAAAPAFLTSVTTPSLTSPAATDLTLGTGTFGTALTVASATGNVGIGATPSAWGGPNIPALDIGAYGAIYSATGVIGVGTSANCYYNGTNWIYKSSQYATVYYHGGGNHVWLNSATGVGGNTVSFTQAMTLGPTGTLSIASSTAGSAGAGALVVTGGLSAGNNGNASYFGGAVSVTVSSGPTLQINNVGTDSPYIGFYRGGTIRSALQLFTDNDFRFYSSNLSTYAAISAGAATFAGAVTVTGALKLGNAYVAGAVVGTGSITIQDSTGTTYRIPVLV